MKVKPQIITIDIGQKENQTAWVILGELGVRDLDIRVVQNGRPFDISGIHMSLYSKTPKDNTIFNTIKIVDAKKGKGFITIPEQISSQIGKSKCCITFIKDGKMMLSFNFEIKIQDSIYNEGPIVASDEFGSLVDALSDVADLEGNYVPRLTQLENGKTDKTTTAALSKRVDGVDAQLADMENQSFIVDKATISYANSLVINKMDNTSMISKSQIPNKSIDQFNITDELKQMILGTTPLNTVPANDSVLETKLGFVANVNLYVNRPFDATITGSGTSSILNVIFASNTIWFSQSSNGFGWKSVILSNVTKTIPHGQRLVLDTVTSTIVVESYSTQLNPKFIILLQNTEGFITGKISAQAIAILNNKRKINETNIDIPINTTVYINRDFLVSKTGLSINTIIELEFKSNTLWYSQSILGSGFKSIILIDKKYSIPHNNRLVLNVKNNTIIVENNSSVISNECILLLQNTEGYLVGELSTNVYSYLNKLTNSNVPVYEEQLLKGVVDRDTLKGEPNDLKIALITDCQSNVSYGYNSWLHHYESIVRSCKQLGVDFIGELGDLMMGNNTKEISSQIISETSKRLRESNLPVLRCRGNHDDNSWTAHTQKDQTLRISDKEWFNRCIKPFSYSYDSNFEEHKSYGFKDFEKQKIRVITLDCEDLPYILNGDGTVKYPQIYRFGFQQKQLQWLCEKALNFKNKNDRAEWGVILLNHQFRSAIADDGKHYNDAQLVHILKGFKSGIRVQTSSTYEDMNVNIDYDFTSQGAMEIICGIGGDSHVDNYYEYGSSGIKVIEVMSSLPQAEPNSPNRVPKTESEDCWDIITIDRKSKTIHCTRFGAGVDRTLKY